MTEGNKRQFTPHGIEDILRKVAHDNIDEKKGKEAAMMIKRKKMRTTFTGRQIFELEKMFEQKKYLNAGERSCISR